MLGCRVGRETGVSTPVQRSQVQESGAMFIESPLGKVHPVNSFVNLATPEVLDNCLLTFHVDNTFFCANGEPISLPLVGTEVVESRERSLFGAARSSSMYSLRALAQRA